MEVKITTYNSINSLEFGVLRELPKLRVVLSLEDEDNSGDIISSVRRNFKKITSFDNMFEVIYKIDEGVICSGSGNFLVVKGCSNINVGDVYISYNGYNEQGDRVDNIYRVEKELTDDKKFKELFVEIDKWVEEAKTDGYSYSPRRYNEWLIKKEHIINDEITSNFITEKLKEHKKEKEEEDKKDKDREEMREAEQDSIDSEKEVDYKAKGEVKFSYCSVKKNIIKNLWGGEYILDKNVNKIFSYDDLNSMPSNDTILSQVETFLNDRRISYIKRKNNKEKYKVAYGSDGKCEVGGVEIPKSKLRFILNRVSEGADKKDIKILLKLNGMKADFVGLERLRCDDLYIPIKNKAIDDKTFKVEFIGKTKTFSWDEIKDWFFSGGGRRDVNSWMDNNSIVRFCDEMGIEKKELFAMMKRVKMLNALKDEDEN